MRRALAALLSGAALLALCAAAPDHDDGLGETVEVTEAAAAREMPDDDDEPGAEDDGDSAPFTLVVEHADGWRCSASLVSLRTAVTSARCARGSGTAAGAPPDLWVHVPPDAAPHASRRVARIAFAAESEAAEGEAAGGADVAVLELEAALGGGARAILMATSGAECAAPGACHVVRARRRGARSWLRIADEALVGAEACAALAPRREAARATLCLRGDVLCPSEWGAGVVCEGKLCGVVARSLAEPDERRPDLCGALHLAQPLARWRRFLHCAHTPRACRRGGECAHLCSERVLLDDDASPDTPRAAAAATATATASAAAAADYSDSDAEEHYERPSSPPPPPPPPPPTLPPPRPPAPPPRTDDTEIIEAVSSSTLRTAGAARGRWLSSAAPRGAAPPTRSRAPAAAPAAAAAAAAPAAPPPARPHAARPAAEFEPNRPDFKAGEYGDNAAEYGGDESAPAAPPTRSSPAPAAVTSPPAPAPRHELEARVSPSAPPAPLASAQRAPRPAPRARRALLLLLLLYIAI